MNYKETKNEYHDPDYPEIPVCIKEEKRSQQETEDKIKAIIRKEFTNELEVRESEVMLIDQRMTKARRYLHQIRYHLVNSYYSDPKLSLTSSQIEDDIAAQTEPRARAQVAALLRESQPQVHPSVLKLLGKKSVDIDEILTTRSPRNRTRKNYSAMVNPKNYTTAADETLTLRPPTNKPETPVPPEEPSTSQVKKVPKHLTPKVENVLKLDEITRNKMKHRYRIIIGNTSKYAPAAGRADRSTHKWLLYVRGPAGTDVARVLAAASVRLHPSYAPHHIVRLEKPPFHVSRRGWGEFPARVELHFRLPEVNRPAAVEHTIKLDRNYTGLQTLGAETIVDVWLYSTPDMLEFEYKDEVELPDKREPKPEPELAPAPAGVKLEPHEPHEPPDAAARDSWLDFFARDTTELDVDEMLVKHAPPPPVAPPTASPAAVVKKDVPNGVEHPAAGDRPPGEVRARSPVGKRIVKYVDPATRKIYYLEMDRSLDISKVQEIVIDSKEGPRTARVGPVDGTGPRKVRRKSGASLLRPEVRGEPRSEPAPDLAHIANDHCYAGGVAPPRAAPHPPPRDTAAALDALGAAVARFPCERIVVDYLLRRMPLVNEEAADADFLKQFPFVVDTEEKYWKLDFAKRRNIEWSRAKLINRILAAKFASEPGRVWRTKQILVYSRLRGFYPVRPDPADPADATDDCDKRPAPADLRSLSLFDESRYEPLADAALDVSDDEEVDVVGAATGRGRAAEAGAAAARVEGLEVLPTEAEERLRHVFVERACADIGIELRLEDVGSGYCYSAVHAVLVSALRSFAEELVRGALAARYAPQQTTTVWLGARRAGEAVVRPAHVWAAAAGAGAGRLRLLTRAALAARPATHTPL